MQFETQPVYRDKLNQKNTAMITKDDVLQAQKAWGAAIVEIGSLKNEARHVLEKRVDALLDQLYAFDEGPVLFKPTRATQVPFRPDKVSATSYFIGGNEAFPEDDGFALQPWTAVRFDNNQIITEGNIAYAMGEYYFTDTIGQEKKVEYTFGYRKNEQNAVKIKLHHSSVPFAPTLGT